MATLAADAPVTEVQGYHNSVPIIASDTVYEGAMVGENGAGYGRPLTAGDRFLGHAVEKVDNESGAAGAKNIKLRSGRYRLEVALAGAITDVGQPVYASDDAVLTFSAPGNSYVGVVTRYVSASKLEVEFRPGEVDEFGPNPNRVLKSDNYTTLADDNGKIIYVDTDTKIITLIATVAGYKITVVNIAAAGTALIEVDFNAADQNLGGCGLAAGGDGKKLSNTKATAKRGDYLTFIGDGSAGWNLVDKRGIWAQEA
ncbi:MAG: hypothetical protein ACYTEQ_05630 [Planctomycetota bacterium]|jgi:hypothetical protein